MASCRSWSLMLSMSPSVPKTSVKDWEDRTTSRIETWLSRVGMSQVVLEERLAVDELRAGLLDLDRDAVEVAGEVDELCAIGRQVDARLRQLTRQEVELRLRILDGDPYRREVTGDLGEAGAQPALGVEQRRELRALAIEVMLHLALLVDGTVNIGVTGLHGSRGAGQQDDPQHQ